MNKKLDKVLSRGVVKGRLRVTFADGTHRSYGDPRAKKTVIRLASSEAEAALVRDPALELGELYMDGQLTIEQGTCYDLVATVKRNARRIYSLSSVARYAGRYATAFARERQTLLRAERNIAHHYNLDERFFRLFLDDDLQYTCAYFEHPKQSLEAAQLAKKRHVVAKALVEPGHRVLDIGSGWGGLGLYLADVAGAKATGVTISQPQHAVAQRRAAERGLAERAEFLLQDYRSLQQRFDRIVSVGMFEAIGLKEFDNFFTTAARLLEDRGVMVLHSIGRTRPRPVPSPWMEKYIFPGSYIPALSEVLPAAERAGFMVTDCEILRLHYADTLREWRRRFLRARDEVLKLYDERFLRMWEFYLCAAEAGFRIDRLFVFQLQLVKHLKAVPFTRNYIPERENELRAVEARREPYRFAHQHRDRRASLPRGDGKK